MLFKEKTINILIKMIQLLTLSIHTYIYYTCMYIHFWTLNVSRTASYEITLVCLSVCLSVHLSVYPSVHLSVSLSVTKFSQDWIISFF